MAGVTSASAVRDAHAMSLNCEYPLANANLDILADHQSSGDTVVVDKSSGTTFWDLQCDSANPVSVSHVAEPLGHY